MSSFKQKLEASRKAIAERNASFTRAYKFKEGKTHLLLLPGVKVPENFEREYGAHYIKDPITDKILAVVGDAGICYGKQDPVREAIGKLIDQANKRGDDELVSKAKSWLAKPTYVINAQVIGGVDTENKGKVVQLELSSTTFDVFCGCLEALEEQVDNFSIVNGAAITVERKGLGSKDTRYAVTPMLKQPAAPPSQDVLSQRIDLDTYVDSKFGEQVSKALTQLSNMLGFDVTNSAIGRAIQGTQAIANNSTAAEDDDLLDTSKTQAVDADFSDSLLEDEIPPFAGGTVKAGAKTAPPVEDDFDSMLAELDNM